jgi:hypothetical protein
LILPDGIDRFDPLNNDLPLFNVVTMSNCPNCQTPIEENFDACWKCSYNFAENRIPEEEPVAEETRKIDCLRCKTPMTFSGTLKLHEGARIGFFGDLFEAFVKRQTFDTFVCPECRKVEFFIPQK